MTDQLRIVVVVVVVVVYNLVDILKIHAMQGTGKGSSIKMLLFINAVEKPHSINYLFSVKLWGGQKQIAILEGKTAVAATSFCNDNNKRQHRC